MKSELYVIVYICSLYIFFTAAQNIEIEGENPRKLIGGSNAVIKCKVVTDLANGQDPQLKWYNQAGNAIVPSARINLLASNDNLELSLMIFDVKEDDAGSYNCSGVVNSPESARVVVETYMPLVVTDDDAPKIQKFSNGTDANVKCAAKGQVTTYWYDRLGNQIKSTHSRYRINGDYLEIPNIQTTDDGNYLCRVVAEADFVNINIKVVVTVPPKITRPPTGQNIPVGMPARFECIATAKPEPVYQWFKDDGSIELAGSRYNISDNGVFIIKSVIRDDKGRYRCRAFSEGKMDEAEAELRVLVPPSIVKLDNSTGDEGSGATIKCTASGEPIPSIKWQKKGSSNDFSDGTQNDQTRITVSHQQRPDRMEVEGRLDISNLKSSDAGFYVCKAENEAKIVEKSSYLTVQYKPNFSKVKEDVLYSWAGTSTTITCIGTSVPSSNITWEKEGQAITQGNGYQMSSVTIGEDTTGSLAFSVDFSNENRIYGIYTCKAFNAIGESTRNFTLRKADPPISPSANIKNPTPISLTLVINVPSAKPPVEKIIVNYGNRAPITVQINTQRSVEVVADNLFPSTPYTFKITAKSEVGSSPEYPLQYTTMAPKEPAPVVFAESSKQYGDKPIQYTLTWQKINNGGRPINDVKLKYAEVVVYPNKSQSNEFQFKELKSGWKLLRPAPDATSFEITGLKPSTYYQVEIVATNTEGSSPPSRMIFVTSTDEPVTTVAPEGTKTKDPSKKSQETNTDESIPLGLLIAIIIIVVIIVFIVIDVTCYYKRQCGVFMCIKEKVGRTGSMETRSKEKIIEEGDADGNKNSYAQKPLPDKKQNGLQDVEKEKSNITEHKNGIIEPQKSKDGTDMTQNKSEDQTVSAKHKDLKGQTSPVPKNVEKAEKKPTLLQETEVKQNEKDSVNQKQEKRDLPQEKISDQKQEKNTDDQPLDDEKRAKPQWKTSETLDKKNIIFNQNEPSKNKSANQPDVAETKEEKKVPLLADNKDTEGTDADQEVGETAPSDEKEPEDKEEKPETPEPEKEVEEAEEAKPEDQEKSSSPKEEVKEEPGEKKEGE